ncbi:MAG TPA: YbhB/YbcL family Raf kinase inhibitor-like protein [bacterium]|nr:YbhB/YbcL family Raf kinase inhibitor-like protein [bacterium]
MSKLKPAIRMGVVLLLPLVLLNPAAWAAGDKKKSTLRLQSSSFKDGGMIPAKYASCDGDNVSPELSWKGVPPKTRDFALIVDDPDAPTQTWVHWVIYNIPAKPTDPTSNSYELLENFPRDEESPSGILQGVNDFKKIGYDGPCPPSGLHRYYFKLYALDAPVRLPAGESKDQLLKAIAKHTLAWTQIMGLYGK